MGLLSIVLFLAVPSALSAREKMYINDEKHENLLAWPDSLAIDVDSEPSQPQRPGRTGIIANHIRAESKLSEETSIELPDDPKVGKKIRWVDLKPYRDRNNGDFMYACTPTGGLKALLTGHEFFLFGTAGKRPAWRPTDHENCRHYPRTDQTNPFYANAVGLRYFPKQDKYPKRDKDEMFIDCYDFAKKEDELTCWRWQIKPKCYRTVADEIATYFMDHRDYSMTAFQGLGWSSDRLSQDCAEEPWNGAQGSAHDWMNKTEGEDAMCWTFTWYFKALYCQYRRERKYHCAA